MTENKNREALKSFRNPQMSSCVRPQNSRTNDPLWYQDEQRTTFCTPQFRAATTQPNLSFNQNEKICFPPFSQPPPLINKCISLDKTSPFNEPNPFLNPPPINNERWRPQSSSAPWAFNQSMFQRPPPVLRSQFHASNLELTNSNEQITHSSNTNAFKNTTQLHMPNASIEDICPSNLVERKCFKSDSVRNWLDNWSTDIEKSTQIKKMKECGKSKVKVSEFQKLILEFGLSIVNAEEALKNLSKNKSNETCLAELNNTSKILESITSQSDWFNRNDDVLRNVSLFVEASRRRKKLSRKKKALCLAKKRQRLESWNETSCKIDAVLAKEAKRNEMERDEETLKKEADVVLKEVRQKQEEMTTMSKILDALVALRGIRLKKGDVHGYVSNPKAEEFFSKLQGEFGELLNVQMRQYKSEEEALKVMMESSVHSVRGSKVGSKENLLDDSKVKLNFYRSLFGEVDSEGLVGEQHESAHYNPRSAQELVQRRLNWDSMLDVSRQASAEGQIPMSWISPPSKNKYRGK